MHARLLMLCTGLVFLLARPASAVTAKVCCEDGSSWTIFQSNPDSCDGARVTAGIVCGDRGGIKTFVCPAEPRPVGGECQDVEGNEVCEDPEGICPVPALGGKGFVALGALLLLVGAYQLRKVNQPDSCA